MKRGASWRCATTEMQLTTHDGDDEPAVTTYRYKGGRQVEQVIRQGERDLYREEYDYDGKGRAHRRRIYQHASESPSTVIHYAYRCLRI